MSDTHTGNPLPLTPWKMAAMGEYAEFGPIMPNEVSKRHIRILTALFLMQEDTKGEETEYANVAAIQTLIECFFNRKYTVNELLCWVHDLGKRGYIALFDPDEEVLENCFFGITPLGEKMYLDAYNDAEGRKKFISDEREILVSE